MTIRKLQAMKAKKGFTLIELIVVIAIIAVLAAILIPILMNYVTNSRISSADSEAKTIHNSLSSIMSTFDSNNRDTWASAYSGGVPTGNTATITKATGAAAEISDATEEYVEAFNSETPSLSAGEGVIYTDDRGAIIAVAWDFGTGHDLATWDGDAWDAVQGDRGRNRIFGTYPPLPQGDGGD